MNEKIIIKNKDKCFIDKEKPFVEISWNAEGLTNIYYK